MSGQIHETSVTLGTESAGSPLDAINALLRRRRLILGIPLLLSFAVLAWTLLTPRVYSATAVFAPQARGGSFANMAGLAAQLGVSLPGTDATESPAFYADLIQSEQLLREVVLTEYALDAESNARQANLTDVYEIEAPTREIARDKAVRELRNDLDVNTSRDAGTVSVTVIAIEPHLASKIVERMLALVDQFNRTTRNRHAIEESRFVASRLDSAKLELDQSEAELQRFLIRNRGFERSSELSFDFEKLEREVALRQQLFTALAQAYEQARLEEVRNTSVITIVQAPVPPAEPERRRLILKLILTFLTGMALVSVLVLVIAGLEESSPAGSRARVEFQSQASEMSRNVRQLWQRVVSRRSDGP